MECPTVTPRRVPSGQPAPLPLPALPKSQWQQVKESCSVPMDFK
jgi:hypothetical protein